jgi:hypothetical protein
MKKSQKPKKIDKQRAILNLRKEAQERLLKSETMKFRLDAETLKRLLVLAKKLNKPAGTLVREWVIEKVSQVENGYKESPETAAINIIVSSLSKRGLLQQNQISHIQELLAEEKSKNVI